MNYKTQTTALAAIFVLVGMMFVVPAISEKALAYVRATASGTCSTQRFSLLHPCLLTYVNSELVPYTKFEVNPTPSGTTVKWTTTAQGSSEKGTVVYNVEGLGNVEFYFYNPTVGKNDCDQHKTHPVPGAYLRVSCTKTQGVTSDMVYTVYGSERAPSSESHSLHLVH